MYDSYSPRISLEYMKKPAEKAGSFMSGHHEMMSLICELFNVDYPLFDHHFLAINDEDTSVKFVAVYANTLEVIDCSVVEFYFTN